MERQQVARFLGGDLLVDCLITCCLSLASHRPRNLYFSLSPVGGDLFVDRMRTRRLAVSDAPVTGFSVEGFGFRVERLGFRVESLGSRV